MGKEQGKRKEQAVVPKVREIKRKKRKEGMGGACGRSRTISMKRTKKNHGDGQVADPPSGKTTKNQLWWEKNSGHIDVPISSTISQQLGGGIRVSTTARSPGRSASVKTQLNCSAAANRHKQTVSHAHLVCQKVDWFLARMAQP
jgi:hypothetical protein